MINAVAGYLFGLHGWVAIAIVFVMPLVEASAFVGFVIPGEVAVILGGVLAVEQRVTLPAVLVAAVCGAILGDTVGYWVGHRYGRRLLSGRLGRLVPRSHRDRAERYLAERGGKAVFLGRFTATLCVLVPGLAGMAGMRYRTFLAYNVAGGTMWAAASVLLGYLTGTNWQHAAAWASWLSFGMLALMMLGLAARSTGRRRQHRQPPVVPATAANAPQR